MKKYIAILIAALLILPLISCNYINTNSGLPAGTDMDDDATEPEERVYYNWDDILSEGQYSPLIAFEFIDSLNYLGKPMSGLSVYFPEELIETLDLKPKEGVDYIEFHFEFRLYDNNGNMIKSNECGTFLQDGSVSLEDDNLLWYVYDLTKSGVYALVAYTGNYDIESGIGISLRSAPLLIDISVETDESNVELTAEESRNGTTYAISGDIHFDSIYGYKLSSGDDFITLQWTYPGEDGGLICSMDPRIAGNADIQRFYDFVFDGDTARFRMTLPISVEINVIDNYSGSDTNGTPNAPAEGAYMAVFAEFYTHEWLSERSNEDVYYISVDLDGVLHKNPDLIKLRIKEYLKDTGVILLWENMDILIEQGYIIADDNGFPVYFENGSLFCFNDEALTEELYQASPNKWFGNLGAEGATYKVRFQSGTWEVTSITGMWIS